MINTSNCGLQSHGSPLGKQSPSSDAGHRLEFRIMPNETKRNKGIASSTNHNLRSRMNELRHKQACCVCHRSTRDLGFCAYTKLHKPAGCVYIMALTSVWYPTIFSTRLHQQTYKASSWSLKANTPQYH